MSNPKRHHFVPESYLAGFAELDSGFLNVYSKRIGFWRRQKPKQVMVRNRYYHQHWAPEGVDKNLLEIRLGQEFEPKGQASIKKLITSPESITDDDSANILSYIEFQRLRVPRQAEMAKELARNAITSQLMSDPEMRDTLCYGRVVMKDSFRFEFMRMANGSLTPYMSRMVWKVITAEGGASFITSDSPVTFFNADFPLPTEAGIACYGTIVLFPLDSKHMLVMLHPEFFLGEKGASDTLPPNLQIEDGMIKIHRDIVWDKEAVDHHNWIIFQLAQDLIVGCSKNTINDAVGEVTRGH